jgi:hypothetical protein
MDIKASPAYWLIGIAVTIAGATLAVDQRYAKAGDVTGVESRLKQELSEQRSYTEVGFLKQRKSQLEDKVFELDAKKEENPRKFSDVERKQLFRYKSELDDVNREVRAKQK